MLMLNALPMGEQIRYEPYILAGVALLVIVALLAVSFVKKK